MIEKKLYAGEYHSRKEFVDDVNLMCNNCKKFNGIRPDNIYTNAAYEMQDFVKNHIFLSDRAGSEQNNFDDIKVENNKKRAKKDSVK